ncbi:Hint domain-containing protein [Leisingera daeponensis]|uniref:Hint domain-containing protein n=1 Tax=Leisingera daeponensis TaxID=405746 RepID=UPI001C965A90|nr:Hint domain-containing protein [Leisingera daeponensis]MBY6058533.1 Hint domain-containing protein [Leisingera daeponensis]
MVATTFWARTDSGTANNPALNLTGDPAVEITFVPSGADGDLFLDKAGGAPDPDTKLSIGGVEYDFVFEMSGDLPTKKSDGANQVPDQYEGSKVYVVTVQNYPSPGMTTRLSFMPEEAATEQEMNSFGKGAIDLQNVDTSSGGAVCFAAGSRILTPGGEVCVEQLRPGDLVCTLDSGPQPVRWIAATRHAWPGSPARVRPVLIRAGALGGGLPRRDLAVSPQHRMLMETGAEQVLAPAKGLAALPGIRPMAGKRQVTYYHLLLERHEILFAEGAAAESFYPGPSALAMLAPHARAAVLALCPRLREHPGTGYGPQARRCLSVSQARQLAAERAPEPGAAAPLEAA